MIGWKGRDRMPVRFFKKAENNLCFQFWNCVDLFYDMRICGRSLVRYVPSVFRDDKAGVGSTGSQSTHYVILKRIFSNVHLSSDDAFLDIGCGKGRVLAFLVSQKCPCPLYGVELNEAVGKEAEKWASRYKQISIIIGDAFLLDYNKFTVLSLARPFLPKTFYNCVDLLESTLTHPITLIYWYDQQSGNYLKNRSGWELQTTETVERINGIKISSAYLRYSIWTFDPQKKESSCIGPE